MGGRHEIKTIKINEKARLKQNCVRGGGARSLQCSQKKLRR